MESKRPFMSDGQKKRLLEVVGADEDIKKGKFSNTFTHQIAQKKWTDIATELNAIPGAEKSGVQWKKSWQDLKKSAKKKNTELKTYTCATGGGPPRTLSDNEKFILDILDATAVDGDRCVKESVVEIIYEEVENVATIKNNQEENKEPNITIVPEQSLKENSPPSSPPITNEQSTSKQPKSTNTPKVKRILKSKNLDNSIKSSNRLIELSEQREKMKEKYYKEKLEIFRTYYEQKIIIGKQKLQIQERNLDAQIRMAAALEELV